jgi:hypothetical protein
MSTCRFQSRTSTASTIATRPMPRIVQRATANSSRSVARSRWSTPAYRSWATEVAAASVSPATEASSVMKIAPPMAANSTASPIEV